MTWTWKPINVKKYIYFCFENALNNNKIWPNTKLVYTDPNQLSTWTNLIMPVNVTVMKQRNKNAIKFEFEYSSFSCEETSGSSLFEPLKILTRKNSVFGHFSRSANYLRYGYKKKLSSHRWNCGNCRPKFLRKAYWLPNSFFTSG